MSTTLIVTFFIGAIVSFVFGARFTRDSQHGGMTKQQNDIQRMFRGAAEFGVVILRRDDGRLAVITCEDRRVSQVQLFPIVSGDSLNGMLTLIIGREVVSHLCPEDEHAAD